MASSGSFHRKFTIDTTYPSGATPTKSVVDDGLIRLVDNVQRGGPVKGWRKVISSGGNATTSLSGTKWSVVQIPGFYQTSARLKDALPWYPGNADSKASGNFMPTSIPNVEVPHTLGLTEVSATNQALTRYYSNLAGVSSRFKGMVLTGELRELLSMVRHPARALRNGIGHYLGALRKGAGRVAKRNRPSFVRRTWLEYSFGWRPLIADIDSAISAYYQSQWARPIFQMVKGTGRDAVSSIVKDATSVQIGPYHRLVTSHLSEEEVYVKYFGIYFSNGSGIPNSHSYGFSPWEFVPTVWELLPYSFLVDYFTNIGGMLTSWSYRFLANGWTAKTTRRVFSHSNVDPHIIDFGINPAEWDLTAEGHPGSASYTGVRVVRIPNAPLDLPSLELRVPGRWDQWVNIVALTKSRDASRKALAR